MGTIFVMLTIVAIIADIAVIGYNFNELTANVLGSLFTACAIGSYPFARLAWKQDAERNAAQDEDARQEREQFFSAPLQSVECGLNLNTSESCYWVGEASEIMNVKHSQRVGYYGGPSVRVARGVYMRAGTSRSHTVSQVAPEVVDHGTLYLTNQRIIFSGGDGSKVFTHKQILRFETFTDGFSLDIPNAKRVTFVTHEPAASWTLERIARGDYAPSEAQLALS